ncbi:hypothetical protein [Micromonospora sp. RTGN7]|uniref:hypothetical protein n=1 Tax=Micromonospora sp. RTGN7 TaxID=3016526 RepID=UPI0029FF4712|nr:hypothetical protein [Micromonospora sp. RTGN7]
MVGLTIGPRQGEALGLTWKCVDLDAGTIARDWQLQRLRWRHACADPAACAAQHCRREACPPTWVTAVPDRMPATGRRGGARTGRRPVDVGYTSGRALRPSPAGCTRHAARCPDRTGGGLVLTRPKTWTAPEDDEVATDVVALPETLRRGLREHQRRQKAARKSLGKLHEENDLVFLWADGSADRPARRPGRLVRDPRRGRPAPARTISPVLPSSTG